MAEVNREFETPWAGEPHRRRPLQDRAEHRRRTWTPIRGVTLDGDFCRQMSGAGAGHLGVAGNDGHVKIGAVRESGVFTHPHRRHSQRVQ